MASIVITYLELDGPGALRSARARRESPMSRSGGSSRPTAP